MVDIKPWGHTPDILDATEEKRLDAATACFHDQHVQKEDRRSHYAVFLVSNDLSKGILFTYEKSTNRAKVAMTSGRV